MPSLLVKVFADARQYYETLAKSEKAAVTFTAETEKMGASAKTAAEAQVSAAVKSTESLRRQIVALKELAAASEKGSAEQVAAARLAERAEQRLAGSLAVTAHEARRLGTSAATAEKEVSRMGRGLAFASGGFLAFSGAAEFIRGSIDATREAVVSQRQLAAQMRTTGESFSANREQILRSAESLGKYGFNADEATASLTVLERGTGSIRKAMSLQGLAADVARGRGVKLGQASLAIAKVFGGQETALRRMVPGLSKHAHGWDLIRLAMAKMAGQAAAGTTPIDRLGAELHNTEEVIGEAFVPSLNKAAIKLGDWLQKMNDTGRLQKDVAQAGHLVATAFDVVKTALDPLVMAWDSLKSIVGGTKNAMYALIAAFAAFKVVGLTSSIINLGKSIGLVGTAASGATVEVSALRAAILGPGGVVAAGGAALLVLQKKIQDTILAGQKEGTTGLTQGSTIETALVPALAKRIEAMKAAGKTGGQILTALRQRLGDPKGLRGATSDLIAEAFVYANKSDPALTRRINEQVKKRAEDVKKTVNDVVKKHSQLTGAERATRSNQWFDARIARQLDRVQDLSLKNQLGRLKQIATVIKDRIDATSDLTRRLKLQDQYVQILRQEKDVQSQITDQMKKQTQAVKDRADAIKSAVLNQFDRRQTAIQNQRALQDAMAQLRLARQIGGPQGIRLAARDVADARAAIERANLEAAKATLHGGRFALGNIITINVHGTDSPEAVARKVVEQIHRRERHTTRQTRGAGAGTSGSPR